MEASDPLIAKSLEEYQKYLERAHATMPPNAYYIRICNAPEALTAWENLQRLSRLTRALLTKQGENDVDALYEVVYSRYYQEELAKEPAVFLGSVCDEFVGPAVTRSHLNTVQEIVCAQKQSGNWSWILADLLGNLESPHLLVDLVPTLIEDHPKFTNAAITDEIRQKVVGRFIRAGDGLGLALQSGLIPNPQQIRKALEVIILLKETWNLTRELYETVKNKVKKDMDDSYDAFIVSEIERAEPIKGSQNHIDQFEANREIIGSTV